MQDLGWRPIRTTMKITASSEMNWHFTRSRPPTTGLLQIHGVSSPRSTDCGRPSSKPFIDLTNGCHVHVSLWKDGANLFEDKTGKLGLSSLAYKFLGGIIHSAEGLAALFNPTVNSYKRINAPPTISGATWSPSSVTYSGNNRTHLIRIPEAGRFEIRLADGAANPYLLQAGILAAGLVGIANERHPGNRLGSNMYTQAHGRCGPNLPGNLLGRPR